MATVDLARNQAGVRGGVGELTVDLRLDVPNSHARISGETMGARVEGYWHIESNADTLDPAAMFIGAYDEAPVLLRNEVHLTPGYQLRYAELSGSITGRKIEARLDPVEAPAHGPSVLGVDGDFDSEVITLLVAIDDGRKRRGRINGSIGVGQVNLDFTPTAITGTYSAPAALLPLLIGSMAYFI